MKNTILSIIRPVLDIALAPLTFGSALVLKVVRRLNIQRYPLTRGIFYFTGIYPIRDRYDEPLFNPVRMPRSLREDRDLPGIDMNVNGQLALLERFTFAEELDALPLDLQDAAKGEFYMHNGAYASGDAEFLYNMVRLFKPRRFVEIGSGYSTLMTLKALEANRREDPSYECHHICIEPWPYPWLREIGSIELRTELVENVSMELFESLGPDDILFIDSSHMIRPQGDVLFEFLQVLPRLRPGVHVHVHDIFTPKDYLDQWLYRDMKLWNEQYLMEALFSMNQGFEITGAVNFLKHHHYEAIGKACPVLGREPEREPGAFWVRRV